MNGEFFNDGVAIIEKLPILMEGRNDFETLYAYK
jgi:hypothetical protein